MKNHVFFKALLFVLLLASADILAAQPAQPARPASAAGRQGGRGPFGDWDLKVEFDPFDMDAILSFSRNEKGELGADWISFLGVNPLRTSNSKTASLSFLCRWSVWGRGGTPRRFNGQSRTASSRACCRASGGTGRYGERIPRLSRRRAFGN